MASGERGEARASLTRISESLTQCREPLAWGKKPPKLPQSCGEDNGEDRIMDEIPSFFLCFLNCRPAKKPFYRFMDVTISISEPNFVNWVKMKIWHQFCFITKFTYKLIKKTCSFF